MHPYDFLMFSGVRERGHSEQIVNKDFHLKLYYMLTSSFIFDAPINVNAFLQLKTHEKSNSYSVEMNELFLLCFILKVFIKFNCISVERNSN